MATTTMTMRTKAQADLPPNPLTWADERLTYETDNVRRTLVELAKFYFGTEFQSKSPAEKEAMLRDDEEIFSSPYVAMKDNVHLPAIPNPFDKVRKMLDYFGRNNPVFMRDPNRFSERARKALTDAAEIAALAEQIAAGHAYDKHVVAQDEYPEVLSRKQFQEVIQKILSRPTEWKPLRGGRSAYWDKETGTVVIRDPTDPDGGTAFRQKTGKRYYDTDLK